MKKMVVFNVGGALSSYLEIGDKTIIIDLGKSSDFSPVNDFLIPLFKKRQTQKNSDDKYNISQLIISHPHKDHISDMIDFNTTFSPLLLTCPNDKEQSPRHRLDFSSHFDKTDPCVKELRTMFKNRNLPLRTTLPSSANDNGNCDRQFLFYLPPKDVENDDDLSSGGECYENNVSLVNLFRIDGYWVLFPGDLMKNGSKKLIQENTNYKHLLQKEGVHILVAPHHGLQSSFSIDFFNTIRFKKTQCLNIISEKINSDDNRDVDSRYYNNNFCIGNNGLKSNNGSTQNYCRRTSTGHICIDFEQKGIPKIQITQDTKELLNWFLE